MSLQQDNENLQKVQNIQKAPSKNLSDLKQKFNDRNQ